jgi:formate C-acetyltransferase
MLDQPHFRRDAADDAMFAIQARALRESEHLPWQRRRAIATRDRMAARRFVLDDHELIVGRPFLGPAVDEAQIADAHAYMEAYPWVPGQTGHCELDLSEALEVGIDGIRARIDAGLAGARGEQMDTLRSFLDVLDGLTALLDHAAEAAEDALELSDEPRASELRTMLAACRHVAHLPPRTFHEALQLHWAIWLGISWDDGATCIALGHLDRWARELYEADLQAGRLTREGALELIENVYLLMNDCWGKGSALAVMVSGRDAAGRDVTCDVSQLCLEALRRTRLAYPTVGICWHEQTPADLTDLAIELIAEGIANPAFFGDETIQRGLRSLGMPADEACHYIHSSCVEITPVGSSNVWVASPYFPVCRTLLAEIDAQVADGEQAKDFEAFLARLFDRLGEEIAEGARQQATWRAGRRERGRHPLQSVFTRDCIARARDLDDGGARYNWVECSFVGLPNLVDSLEVIRREVYEGGGMTLADVKDVLDADFAGREDVLRRWRDELPKYGQDVKAVDALFDRVVSAVRDHCRAQSIEGEPMVPGAFCWVMHERLGGQCPATPDGRRAREPFADGVGPAQGRETRGPTASVLSTTRWDHRPMIGGVAFNMKFSRSMLAEPKARASLGDLVLTFLRRGGFETQINVVDAEVLRKARANPEAYQDLVVRIGGYTDYFARLSEGMQDEIIRRTEHQLL